MTLLELKPSLKTVSGKPLLVGTGSGTKWKEMKRADPATADLLVAQLKLAMEKGFYHLDTAEIYDTQVEVGKALKEANIKREDFWITSKYSNWSQNKGPLESIDAGLKEVGTDYFDLYLIHCDIWSGVSNGHTLETAWRDLITAKQQGKVRYIGVSNFPIESLKVIIEISKEFGDEYLPIVNQIEFHPYLKNQTPGVYEFCQENNILIEAYGPLTPLMRVEEEHPLTDILAKLSEKYQKTDAQILLRWVLQKNVLPITTSGNETRIEQSLEIYNFELDPEDVESIDKVEDKFHYQAFTFVLKK